ncbi:hypothetical protein FAF44_49180 [Nonomuraea sp. MG754425]|nr:hypothetical protein [Nonomuraea sp. MG754425]
MDGFTEQWNDDRDRDDLQFAHKLFRAGLRGSIQLGGMVGGAAAGAAACSPIPIAVPACAAGGAGAGGYVGRIVGGWAVRGEEAVNDFFGAGVELGADGLRAAGRGLRGAGAEILDAGGSVLRMGDTLADAFPFG